MPTYEYRCNACGREFEIQQKMSDPDLVKCEACGEDKLEKLISWTMVNNTAAQEAALFAPNPKHAMRSAFASNRPPKKSEPKAEAQPQASAEPEAKVDAQPDVKAEADVNAEPEVNTEPSEPT